MSASTTPSIIDALSPTDVDAAMQKKVLRADIDASCRFPVLLFFACSVVWLFIGTVFAMLASWKMHNPELLANYSWLTFGRVRPAHLNAVIFGFASEAAIGVSLWLMCRLCRVKLMYQWLIMLAAVFWNVGLTVGMLGILAGESTGIEWLEIPGYAAPILFFSYALIGVWGIITFRFRRENHLYVSQWYILAALIWFPWIYSAANIMLVFAPVRGTVQAAVNWWFAHNVLGLWFTPIGIASVYYFIPKVIGRPIHSYYLSVLGFWTLALFYNWNGMHHLVGGPMPAWLITVSIVASVLMTIPVVTVGINHHMTMWGSFHKLKQSPTLQFMVFGGMNYTIASLHGVASALRTVSETTHFTHHTIAHSHSGMYAFFTMIMFGSMYYIVPRLTQREWPSARLIHIHFWGTAVGILLYIVPLSIGGILQGIAMNNPDMPFLDVVKGTLPWLRMRTFAGVLISVGHVAFVIHLTWILFSQFSPYREPDPRIAEDSRIQTGVVSA
jgi:cytochrome c oxidase cbb3-type subunit 1